MQRATATTGRWAGALGVGLVLPFFSTFAHAGAQEAHALVQASVTRAASADASPLARWRDYALASITPQFSWALPARALVAPRVLDNYSAEVPARALLRLQGPAEAPVAVSIATETVSDTPSLLPGQAAEFSGLRQGSLQRTVVTPSLTSQWGEAGNVRIAGVLAYQRFASVGLGTRSDGFGPLPGWLADSSYGVGARVDVGSAVGERLHWNLSYQSRVGMGEFASYRGVYADSGDFDIPASAALGLAWALAPAFDVDLGVRRVQYSAIRPFTSGNLPTRFLALLGDSASPVFAWRDLTIYSIGGTLRGNQLGDLQLRYTTRQQPLPTSPLLARALEPALANDMLTLAWSRPFGENAGFRFAASYASSPYLLMMPTTVSRRDATAGQFEFEALWSQSF